MNLIPLLKGKQLKAIAPHYDGTHLSVVFTQQGELYKEEFVDEVMDRLCRYFGSTLEGRKQATRDKLGIRKNPSIILSEILQLGAFEVPHTNQESIWIIDINCELNELEKGCELLFDNQLRIYTPLSFNSVQTRKQRAIHMLHEFIHTLVSKYSIQNT